MLPPNAYRHAAHACSPCSRSSWLAVPSTPSTRAPAPTEPLVLQVQLLQDFAQADAASLADELDLAQQ